MVAGTAAAETITASVGNYYYEDDRTGDRERIVVERGDQIAFTVREGIYPPHTVDVDELGIHSGGILLGETYTTPPLNTPGDFLLYCRPHRDRGHVARLVVRAPAPTEARAPTEAPASPVTPAETTTEASAPAGAPSPSRTPDVSPTPSPTLAPVGIRTASPEELSRPVAVDPDSLEGLTGRVRSTAPWTRALWFLLIASVPVVGAAAFAVRRELVRAGGVSDARGSARSSGDRRRSSSRSPRSSARKASGSGRRSRGRRR